MEKKNQLPKNAQRVFQGALFDVYQWNQEMFDGSREVFERVMRPDTAMVIPVVGEKILIIEQRQPDQAASVIGLPGGRVGRGEDPLRAAQRELLEETGYVSDDWVLWNECRPVAKMEWTVYTYIARGSTKRQEPHLDPGEKISPRFISFDEFLALADEPNFYERELIPVLLRARYETSARVELSQLLFGKRI